MSGELVLVTGGSGFIAMHCMLKLFAAGYRVRTTVRSLAREAEVRATLKAAGAEPGDRLAFFPADLTADAGWTEAAAGCDYVMHVASPFPVNVPQHEDELIVPAREGALRLLRAARAANVRRVVLTSSFAAIGYGHPPVDRPFTESDWSNAEGEGVSAYAKSKTLAERAAWDYMAREGGDMELAVVNPVGVFGPALGADISTSIEIVKRMMDGALPALPRITFGVVDVRDVADLHLMAMTHPDAAGERYLAVAGEFVSMREIGLMLKRRLGAAAKPRADPRAARLAAAPASRTSTSPSARSCRSWASARTPPPTKARRELGWQPRSAEDAVAATAESLVSAGAPEARRARLKR